MMSSMVCHHRNWTTFTRLNNVGRGINHNLCIAYTVRRCWTCHSIITHGKHTRLDDVSLSNAITHWTAHTIGLHRLCYEIMALRQHTRSNDIVKGMLLSHLGITHGRMTSGVRCCHFPGAAQTIRICRAWHAFINYGCRIQTNLIYLLDFPIVLY